MYKIFEILLFTSILQVSQIGGETSCPIIGIVCHEMEGKPGHSYISASYVKAVEAAGARVAPIFLWKNDQYISRMVKSVNGILLQGGNAKYDVKGGYFQTAARIFAMVRKLNYMGDHLPILGVCLGFEFLSIYSNGMDPNTLDTCKVEGEMLPLHFTQDFRNSSLYGNASHYVIDVLANQNVTPNYHSFCLRTNKELRHKWHILSTNKDENDIDFVSSMETDGPMAAIQFHPEKNAYIWDKTSPPTQDALLASRHFYDWLVMESRKNDHSFSSHQEEISSLIYNYCPIYTTYDNSSYRQMYYFD